MSKLHRPLTLVSFPFNYPATPRFFSICLVFFLSLVCILPFLIQMRERVNIYLPTNCVFVFRFFSLSLTCETAAIVTEVPSSVSGGLRSPSPSSHLGAPQRPMGSVEWVNKTLWENVKWVGIIHLISWADFLKILLICLRQSDLSQRELQHLCMFSTCVSKGNAQDSWANGSSLGGACF